MFALLICTPVTILLQLISFLTDTFFFGVILANLSFESTFGDFQTENRRFSILNIFSNLRHFN